MMMTLNCMYDGVIWICLKEKDFRYMSPQREDFME